MTKHLKSSPRKNTSIGSWIKAGCVAGFAGGLAEVAVMGLYSWVAGLSGMTILQLITASFASKEFAFGATGAFDGLMIHFVLSVIIGAAFGILQYIIHKDRKTVSYQITAASGVVALCGIWAFNFFVLLPEINPAFVAYVSYAPSFVSKLSFGVSLILFARLFEAGRTASRTRLVLVGERN